MKEVAYKCDMCGATRGKGNHWLLMNDIAPEDSSPLFFPWTDSKEEHRGHICSSKCAHAALDRWIANTQQQSHAGGEDIVEEMAAQWMKAESEAASALDAKQKCAAMYPPEEVYTADALRQWAEENGYVAEQRIVTLEEAAAKFVAKLDKVTPSIDSAFMFQAIHGFPYIGENYERELLDLRAALASPAPEAAPQGGTNAE